MTEKQKTYSRTALETFSGCAFRFNELVNRGIEDAGDEAARGSLFHDVTRAYALALFERQIPADFELLQQTFRAVLAEANVATVVVDETWRLLQRWGEVFELDLRAFMLTEETQVTSRLRWTPDLVYARPGVLSIPDWKTWYRGYSESLAREQWQPKFYTWQARQLWPNFERYEFVYEWVRSNKRTVVTYTPEEIDAFADQVEAVIERIKSAEASGEWPATAGAHCTMCRLTNCPLAEQHAIVQARVLDRSSLDAACGQWLALESKLKTIKAAVAGYCATAGPAVVGGQEFSVSLSESKHIKARAAMDILDHAGRASDANQIDISLSSVWKAAPKKSLPTELVTEIEAAARTENSWKFGHHRAKAIVVAEGDAESEEA
jgi:hypothetical protein